MTNDFRPAIAQVEQLARGGNLDAAEVASQALVTQWPLEHEAWAWHGTLALIRGRWIDAEASLRQAIALAPGDAHYWTNLALAIRSQGRAAEAEPLARQAVSIDASQAVHWQGLANCLFDQQRWNEAAQCYREAIARDASDAQAWTNLGAVEQSMGRLTTAEEAYRRSLSLAPGELNATIRYASLLVEQGNFERGVNLLRQIVAQLPQLLPAWLLLGNAYRLMDDLAAAEVAYRQAIQIDPRNRDARYHLALVLLQRLCYREAELWAQALVAENPQDADAWMALGGALHVQSRVEEAVFAMRRSVELVPHVSTHSKLLVALHYAEEAEPQSLLTAHRQWAATYAAPLMSPAPPGISRRSPGEPLRLGFVALDFSAGPAGLLGLPAIEHLDKAQCTVACYSDRHRQDEFTARFRAASQLWRNTLTVSDEDLARQVRTDEIDILIDLGGHVGRRLLVFARRPAAYQATWLGYVGTTGMAAMDGLIADRFHVRPGEESYYAEQVLRMPHDYISYGPSAGAPAVGPPPALSSGQFTFGSFNNPAKYGRRILDVWAEILKRVPAARLFLKYGGLDQPDVAQSFRQQFVDRGIPSERILLEGWSDNPELLARYGRVDIALDPQPYSGGLTTCEALWMGVPVLTWPGKTFAGRHSTSHLNNSGYPQFVAQDAAEYIEQAVKWTTRLDELAAIRSQMRDHVRQSSLCDAPRFAKDLLALLRGAWETKFQIPNPKSKI